MRKIFIRSAYFIFALLVLVLPSCGSGNRTTSSELNSADAELIQPKPVIKIARGKSRIVASIAEQLIETYVRYPVVVESREPSVSLFEELENGSLDVALEVWPQDLTDETLRYITEGRVNNFGRLGVSGRTGWYVPSYDLEKFPALTSYEAFRNSAVTESFSTPGSSPSGRFLGMQDNSGEIDESLISILNLPLVVEYSGGVKQTDRELGDKVTDQSSIVVLATSPSYLINKYDLVPVETPIIANCISTADGLRACDQSSEELIKLVSKDLSVKSEKVYEFLKDFSIPEEDLLEMMLEVDQGSTHIQVAKNWIDSNEVVWRDWVEQ